MVQLLAKTLPDIATDWSRWYFFFCDERIVPFDSNDSTYGEYKTKLIGKIPVTEEQFIKIDPDLSGKMIYVFQFVFPFYWFHKISLT